MERYVLSEGARLWTEVQGEGRLGTVVLCGGGPGCCDYLRPVSEMLEDGYRVIRFEQRGCGRSDADGRYGLETAVDDLETIRREYAIESLIVGGHSWGANLALCYTLRFPERVDALLYIAGNGFQNDRGWSEEYHANREQYGEDAPEMDYPFNGEVNRIGNATFREYIHAPTVYRDISRLETRALFLVGAQDIRPRWPVEQLAALMKNSRFSVIEGAAHFLWLQKAEEMRSILRSFLSLR